MRQALARLTLPVLIAAAFALVLVGKADTLLAMRLRVALDDAMAPIYGAIAGPVEQARNSIGWVRDLFDVQAENARLRAENARLLRWQHVAEGLALRDSELEAQLHWMPAPPASFVTAPIVDDTGGLYAHAVLVALQTGHTVRKGDVALDGGGLVGRVTEVGARSARVLLITDLNSRVPVMLVDSHAPAMMVGDNSTMPHLMFWPQGTVPREGERVVTSAAGGVFPADLPVGTVHYSTAHVAEVLPDARLDRLDIIRLFDFGALTMQTPEETATAHRDGPP
jgi:rod shape-determining protein MreC